MRLITEYDIANLEALYLCLIIILPVNMIKQMIIEWKKWITLKYCLLVLTKFMKIPNRLQKPLHSSLSLVELNSLDTVTAYPKYCTQESRYIMFFCSYWSRIFTNIFQYGFTGTGVTKQPYSCSTASNQTLKKMGTEINQTIQITDN